MIAIIFFQNVSSASVGFAPRPPPGLRPWAPLGTSVPRPSWGPIFKISYDNLTIMPKLRSTYDGRLIYKTSYEGLKAFLRYDSLAKL